MQCVFAENRCEFVAISCTTPPSRCTRPTSPYTGEAWALPRRCIIPNIEPKSNNEEKLMQGMTKRELQITDPQQILSILDNAKVLQLGLAVDNEPYVVPMNYGYHMENGRLTLYLHSALQGKKLDMIRANPRVFIEMDCDLTPFEGKVPCQYGLSYSSIMGRGTAHIVEDVEEKKQAMTLLMKTQTGKDFTFEDRLVSIVAVIRIDVEEYTAKHRPVPEKLR